MTTKPQLAIVVPCYNEEEVLPQTTAKLLSVVDRLIDSGDIAATSNICFVDDGSRDRTWSVIRDFSQKHPAVGGIRLSRNRGHQNALMAGLFSSDADLTISIDADLQDDVEAIPKMVDEARKGADIVYGVRRERATDTPAKRLTAHGYYLLLDALGVDIVYDHADFRLLSRRAVQALRLFNEKNLFLRAIIPQLGFETRVVYYDRAQRAAGKSKYPLKKMLTFALEGVTSFSTKPLRIVTWLGLIVSTISSALAAWAIISVFWGNTVPGWASIVIPIYIICGVLLFSLGIIGEYIWKIYLEIKARPRFIIAESLTPSCMKLHDQNTIRLPASGRENNTLSFSNRGNV